MPLESGVMFREGRSLRSRFTESKNFVFFLVCIFHSSPSWESECVTALRHIVFALVSRKEVKEKLKQSKQSQWLKKGGKTVRLCLYLHFFHALRTLTLPSCLNSADLYIFHFFTLWNLPLVSLVDWSHRAVQRGPLTFYYPASLLDTRTSTLAKNIRMGPRRKRD